jgi:hypothetical protein
MPLSVVSLKPRAALQLQVLLASAALVPMRWLQAQPSRAVHRPGISQVKDASVPQRVGIGSFTPSLVAAAPLRLQYDKQVGWCTTRG